MRVFLLISLLTSVAVAGLPSNFTFESPGPEGDAGDYSKNPVFVIGSKINIRWTDNTYPSTRGSIVMYQNLPNAVFEGVVALSNDDTERTWKVATRKFLSTSNIFYFELYSEGIYPSIRSHYFNLTLTEPASGGSSTSSSTSSLSTAAPSSSTANSVSPTDSGSSTSLTSPKPTSASDIAVPFKDDRPRGLSTGAKAGLGVAIPLVVILGAIAGWFLFKRRRHNKFPPMAEAANEPLPAASSPLLAVHEYDGSHAPIPVSTMKELYPTGGLQELHAVSSVQKPTPQPPPSELYVPAEPVELPSGQDGIRK